MKGTIAVDCHCDIDAGATGAPDRLIHVSKIINCGTIDSGDDVTRFHAGFVSRRVFDYTGDGQAVTGVLNVPADPGSGWSLALCRTGGHLHRSIQYRPRRDERAG